MYERMQNKEIEPTLEEMYSVIGPEGVGILDDLEQFLRTSYDIVAEVRFPFGIQYGWGIKFSHRTKHLCYVFPENGSFTVTTQIGAESVKLEARLDSFLPRTQDLWKHRYPCGKGGWIHYRVLDRKEIEDIKELIRIKKSPVMPANF